MPRICLPWILTHLLPFAATDDMLRPRGRKKGAGATTDSARWRWKSSPWIHMRERGGKIFMKNGKHWYVCVLFAARARTSWETCAQLPGTSDEGKGEQNKIRRFISFFVSIEGGWRNGWRTYRENIYIIFLLAQSLLAAWIATGASFSCGTIWFSRQRRRKWEKVDDGNDIRQLLSSNVANFFCWLPILWLCLYGSSVLQKEKKIVYWFDLWCSTLFYLWFELGST